MKRGTVDPSFEVSTYDKGKAYFGTTLLPDNHDLSRPRIIEVNMLGEIVWEYDLPADMRAYTNPGFDAQRLQNGNVLFLLPRKGVYEINQDKQIVWSYVDPKVSHDADRLPDGNTLLAYGAFDTQNDAQAKEVTPAGQVVWSYYARNYFGNNPKYSNMNAEGWTHTNGVIRLANGNTVVSHRNFNLLAEVDAQGNVVRTIENSEFVGQHDPEYLPNGNLLFATHTTPQKAVEIDPGGNVVWSFTVPDKNSWPLRDADRLPNGNTLITGSTQIIEVTADGEVVWAFRMKGVTFASLMEYASRGFYKAQRLEPN
ncbi:MAG: aryl-sulfate sulfotransferase [Candidatus Micrarchaeota archaeon]|nr:aryl-sulfate sulfotransferase [Candidatus Micrarchaeota archaeon]